MTFQSFIERAEAYIAQSDFLYPSNFEKKICSDYCYSISYENILRQREAKYQISPNVEMAYAAVGQRAPQIPKTGKITKTVESLFIRGENIFSQAPKGWVHTFGKPFRFVLRTSILFVVATVFSPIGLIYNSKECIVHTVRWYKETYPANKELHVRKIQDAFLAVMKDAIALVVIYACVHIPLSSHLFPNVYHSLPTYYVKNFLPHPSNIKKLYGLIFMGAAFFGISGSLPTAFKCDRGFTKAVVLKNELGLVTKDGLLGYEPHEAWDFEVFEEIYTCKAHYFFELIALIQRELPPEHRIPFQASINIKAIIQHLRDNRQHLIIANGKSNEVVLQEWETYLQKSYKEYKVSENMYLKLQKAADLSSSLPEFDLRRYFSAGKELAPYTAPKDIDYSKAFTPGDAYNLITTTNASTTEAERNALPTVYTDLRKKILLNQPMYLYQFLGFEAEPTSSAEVKTAFRRFAFQCAPDKMSNHPKFINEATEIFKFVVDAYNRYK